MRLLIELLEVAVVVVLVVAALAFAFGGFARRQRPGRSEALEARRLAILLILVCVVGGLQIAEDALDGDSRPLDEAVLLYLHENAPPQVVRFFEQVTLTGSSRFLTPLTILVAGALLLARRRFEAALLAGSTLLGALLIYSIKWLVQRERPQLWDTAAYWGSSFPSGHTLTVAAFATAAALCVARIRPGWHAAAAAVAVAWIGLVGLSRLVLGVHWPTDVLVAACIGATVPMAISVAHELRRIPGGERAREEA
jgi:undecaprenyl-diphosphatase